MSAIQFLRHKYSFKKCPFRDPIYGLCQKRDKPASLLAGARLFPSTHFVFYFTLIIPQMTDEDDRRYASYHSSFTVSTRFWSTKSVDQIMSVLFTSVFIQISMHLSKINFFLFRTKRWDKHERYWIIIFCEDYVIMQGIVFV